MSQYYPVLRTGSAGRLDIASPIIVAFGIAVIALPKAGILVGGDVPIYGSVIVGQIVSLIGWVLALRHVRGSIEKIGISLVLLAFVVWFGHFLIELNEGMQARRAARAVFFFLPMTGFGVYFFVKWIKVSDILIERVFLYSFYSIIIYATAQLLFGADVIAVQYVTANFETEFDEIISKSNVIHRLGGESYKLFGTYQNGNLFSIGLILLFPVAFYIEKRAFVKYSTFAVLHIVIFYSASTTSYLSIIALDLIFIYFYMRKYFVHFLLFGLILGFAILSAGLVCSDGGCGVVKLLEAKLFERDLTENMRWLKTDMWLGRMSENVAILFVGEMSNRRILPIFEVLPFSIFQYYGVFVLLMFYAFFILALRPWAFAFYKAGFVAYLVTSFGSGGFWLTPTPYLLGFGLGLIARLDRERDRQGRFSRPTHG